MLTSTRRATASIALLGAACLAGCGGSSPLEESAASAALSDAPAQAGYGDRTRARLINGDGTRIGEIMAWQGRRGLVLEIEVQALPPGGHGLHLHQRGDCSDIGSFKASKGHVTHDEQPHGFLHPSGTHAGDLPNLYVAADGSARIDLFSTDISLTDLTDADGAAIIIHAARDDYQTQPIGGAGPRLACAAFHPRS